MKVYDFIKDGAMSKAHGNILRGGRKMANMQIGVRQTIFSKHAMRRLADRHIQFDRQAMKKLNEAVDRLSAKGAKAALVYLNDVAMVVRIRERTVVTAVDGESARENIFTKIDSAAIL